MLATHCIITIISSSLYKEAKTDNPVNFANWLALGVPMSVTLVLALWLWMQLYMEGLGCLKFWKRDTTNYDKVKVVLRREYVSLGSMSYAEKSVAICFVIMALLWITRKPGFIPGWGDLFKPKYVGDSTPAILISIVLFILPAKAPWRTCDKVAREEQQSGDEEEPSGQREVETGYGKLLDWTTVNNRLSWNVLLLMGGGFALATGCERSGLSAWVSSNLSGLSDLPTWTVTLLLSVTIAHVTEVTSNSATTTLFVPIVGQTAIGMGVNPLTFMIAVTIASSLAFMLPVATPPNAIVFASGYLKITDMFLFVVPGLIPSSSFSYREQSSDLEVHGSSLGQAG
ncbi:solute carrier family 13 member 2-like [Elysia marginata]|uniref:Solute carrier family 13 member 2-like n=1 Tax=Elysia marginata TaxID=1093978 RepID=A0AAV4F3K7_9GAST|nr:solute carrier family 13 member 2-like [Elysia marginata]